MLRESERDRGYSVTRRFRTQQGAADITLPSRLTCAHRQFGSTLNGAAFSPHEGMDRFLTSWARSSQRKRILGRRSVLWNGLSSIENHIIGSAIVSQPRSCAFFIWS